MEIDTTKLKSDLADPAKAEKAINDVIASLKNFIEQFDRMKEKVEEHEAQANAAVLLADQYLKANDNLIFTIKNIHIALGAGIESELEELKKELSKFVMSPAVIESSARREMRLRQEALQS